MATRVLPGTDRLDVTGPLPGAGCVGIELGVAAGGFSARLMATGRFRHLYGVDAYADGHGIREYRRALLAVGLGTPYTLLRMTFAQALPLFPPDTFDFVYCDGYAHTGEEGGTTLTDWYARLKPGGVMAGDDYDAEVWPLVVWAVHHLAAQVGAELLLTDRVEDAAYSRYRSWFFVKPADGPTPRPDPMLRDLGLAERDRIAAGRKARRKARRSAAAQDGAQDAERDAAPST
ncbi:MAG TPA: class I SAM-dependent methyltransferase [Paracoccaceae bacterium]|nr:class I SAM-dependent methyltransferase [Paracoccaceae bacterium]HMO71809.1 class I SAM-dependent methyltransferase [Paracoccaceae bacterium]